MTRTKEEVAKLFERNLYPVIQTFPEEFIPYDIIAPHEGQALENHVQTLQQLAERGGLDWAEILAILRGKRRSFVYDISRDEAKAAVLAYIEEKRGERDE